MILLLASFDEYPYDNRADILRQIQYIYEQSFGIPNWDPTNGFHLMLDIEDGNVRGLLSIYVKTEAVGEIYNVCTHPAFRNQGVMKNMFSHLPPLFYYLQATFTNRIAYSAYSRYFPDFCGIGRLTYGPTPLFVFGGYFNASHPPRPEVVAALDHVAQTVESIGSIDSYVRHFCTYVDAYQLVLQHYDLLRQVLQIHTEHIRISHDVIHVFNHSDDLLSTCMPLFQLMNQSYLHGISMC